MAEQPSTASTSVLFATGLATILLVVAVATGLYVIGHAVYGAAAGGHEVSFRGAMDVKSVTPRVPAGVVLDAPSLVEAPVRIHDATAKQQLLALGRDIGPFVLAVVGLWLIRRLLQSVRDGDPFTSENVVRLRIIALLLMLVPVVEIIQHYFDNAIAGTIPGLTNWPNGGHIGGDGPLAGVVVLVLAEVFAHGVRLREDVEGTV